MTVGLLFLLKSLSYWLGLGFLAHTLWQFLAAPQRSWRSAAASVVLLGLSAWLPGIHDSATTGLRLPVVLPILPAEWLLIVPCAVIMLVCLSSGVAAITAKERSKSLGWAGVMGLLALLLLRTALASKSANLLKGGYIHLAWGQALILLPLAILAILAIAASLRTAATRNLARSAALYVGLGVGSVVFGLPLAWMLSTSFRENGEINSGVGIRWIPVVQPRFSYRDPVMPYYSVVGSDVEGVVLQDQTNGNRLIEIRRPLAQIGQTVSVAPKDLVVIPEMKPEVTVSTPTGERTALDLETLRDGRHRLHVLQDPEGTSDLIVEAGKVRPVQIPGLRYENYPDALEFLPPATLRGLVFLKNTLIIVILSVIGSVFSAAIVAYAFARLRFPGKKFLFTLLLSTMMLPSAVTLMPQFLIFRSLGWVDTLKPLWAPAFFASAFNVFMLRQFYASIPIELEEAAKLDGCSVPKTFWSISLPQIKPALATIAIWTAVASWNNFTGPLIYISSPENMPISYAVQLFQGQRSNEPAMLMAFVTMSVIPVVALFLFAQRYFAQTSLASGLGGR